MPLRKKKAPKSQTKPRQQDPDLEQQLEEITANYHRALADYQNLEQRTRANQSTFIKTTTTGVISKFLPILDNLQRAGKHIDDPGLTMVIESFYQTLAEEGVQSVEAQDQTFDPQTMECAEMVPGPKDQVIAVLEEGYHLDGTLIRPAKVTVGTGEEAKSN